MLTTVALGRDIGVIDEDQPPVGEKDRPPPRRGNDSIPEIHRLAQLWAEVLHNEAADLIGRSRVYAHRFADSHTVRLAID